MTLLMQCNKIWNSFCKLFSIRNLFSFEGRANREEFIIFKIAYIFLAIIVSIFEYLIGYFCGFGNGVIIALALMNLVFLIPDIAITVRRFHDLNISGWIFLFFTCFLIVIFVYLVVEDGLVGLKRAEMEFSTTSNIIIWSIIIFEYLILLFVKGTRGSNRYEIKIENKTNYIKKLCVCIFVILILFLVLSLSVRFVYFAGSRSSRLGLEYYKKGEYENALKSFNSAIYFTPNMLSLYSGRGAVLMKLNRLDEALSDYNKFIESRKCLENNCCDIGDIATYKKKIHVLYKQSNYTEAIALCDLLLNIIKDTDDYIFVYLSKSTILNKMESYSESLECVEKTLSLDSKNEKALKLKKELSKKN